jgi:hypothetical protein
MSKLFAASLAFLFAVSSAPFAIADEASQVAPDQSPPVAGEGPHDPDGNEVIETGHGMGRSDFADAPAMEGIRYHGLGMYPEIGPRGTFTIISDGDMQMLLDTRSGTSWLLSNAKGTMKWVSLERLSPNPQSESEIRKRYEQMLQQQKWQSEQREKQAARSEKRLTQVIDERDKEIASIVKQLNETKVLLHDATMENMHLKSDLDELTRESHKNANAASSEGPDPFGEPLRE